MSEERWSLALITLRNGRQHEIWLSRSALDSVREHLGNAAAGTLTGTNLLGLPTLVTPAHIISVEVIDEAESPGRDASRPAGTLAQLSPSDRAALKAQLAAEGAELWRVSVDHANAPFDLVLPEGALDGSRPWEEPSAEEWLIGRTVEGAPARVKRAALVRAHRILIGDSDT